MEKDERPAPSVEEIYALTARRVGERVRERRRALRLTQTQLAERLRSTLRWVAHVEAGEQNLTIASLVKLSLALEIPVAELFG